MIDSRILFLKLSLVVACLVSVDVSYSQLATYSDLSNRGFKGVVKKVVEDRSNSLDSFFQLLDSCKSKQVRIVHIGDSHVRGYAYPGYLRESFERDFGSLAVFPDTLTYRSNGIARETGLPGVVYNVLGVNGALASDFATEEKMSQIDSLKPDLIIVSFGTNESYSKRYSKDEHYMQIDSLISGIRARLPEVSILMTTPPGCYFRERRRRKKRAWWVYLENPNNRRSQETIIRYSEDNNIAYWDMFGVAGGARYAAQNWKKSNLMRNDGVHFTVAGYRLQGSLLYEAIIEAYNRYVFNR